MTPGCFLTYVCSPFETDCAICIRCNSHLLLLQSAFFLSCDSLFFIAVVSVGDEVDDGDGEEEEKEVVVVAKLLLFI